MLDEETLLPVLKAALEPIAKVTGGFATIVNSDGKRIMTVNSQGQEVVELRGVAYPEALEVLLSGSPKIGISQVNKAARAWFLPLGCYVLAASNIERVQEEERLREEFARALPMIAEVAGGDAVLFDGQGIRIAGFNPRGEKSFGIGEYSRRCHEVMKKRKPIVGPSTLVEGAMAVRIPIGNNFGLSINNEWAVKEKKKLLDTISRHQFAKYKFEDIVGESRLLLDCKRQAQKVAAKNSTVLLMGESGTGKELFAQAIHNASERKNGPFLALNCGAIPPNLAESHLFGYEGGAFTGAKREGQKGIFEQANGGTLYLDEISEMELGLQAKLLRVLQEHEVLRVGGHKPIPINVRVIASSNKDLREMIEKGLFREDLYYRLNVIEILIPPLRKRKEDIPILAKHFISKLNPLLGTSVNEISGEAMAILQRYNWPGNIRELQNCIERALMFSEMKCITSAQLPAWLLRAVESEDLPDHHLAGTEVASFASDENTHKPCLSAGKSNFKKSLQEAEKNAIVEVLQAVGYNRQKAARLMGISTTTLWRKMKLYGILDEEK